MRVNPFLTASRDHPPRDAGGPHDPFRSHRNGKRRARRGSTPRPADSKTGCRSAPKIDPLSASNLDPRPRMEVFSSEPAGAIVSGGAVFHPPGVASGFQDSTPMREPVESDRFVPLRGLEDLSPGGVSRLRRRAPALKPFFRSADTLDQHRRELRGDFFRRVSTGPLEGLNSKIKRLLTASLRSAGYDLFHPAPRVSPRGHPGIRRMNQDYPYHHGGTTQEGPSLLLRHRRAAAA